jgi:hypothetical protein
MAVMLAALGTAAMVMGGCDRLDQLWPEPSSVTVKLPPPRTAAPGFAFRNGRKAGTMPLRPGGRKGYNAAGA